jgi:hypothetical protein
VIFVFASAAATTSVPAVARAKSMTRGTLAMLGEFDPVRRQAYDYVDRATLAEDQWLRRSTVVFEREPGSDPDPMGRMNNSLSLPPGRYELRTWFQGDRPRGGAFQAAVGIGEARVLSQIDGPLANPAVLPLDLPVPVPSLWALLTDATSARAARRLEIRPMSLVPAGERIAAEVHKIESLPGRPNAYVAYVDKGTFPENGVFWTRGTDRGALLLAPAGATRLAVTLHVGPVPTNVTIWIGEERSEVMMAAEETRVVRFAIPTAARAVHFAIQASSSFRPSETVSTSTDTRNLGCQARLALE